MRSAETHPTPQRVLDAVQVIAAWLCEIDAVEALISPQGGASWHAERQADRLLAGWGDAEEESERLRVGLEQAQAQAAALRLGLNEAVMLLDYHGIKIPQSTGQALVVHGGANYAGQALLDERAALLARIAELEQALRRWRDTHDDILTRQCDDCSALLHLAAPTQRVGEG